MNPRTQRARQMMQEPGYAIQTAPGTFKVRSQTDPSKSYLVKATADGLICECKDHEFWRADCKHIKIVLETIRKNRATATTPSESWSDQGLTCAGTAIRATSKKWDSEEPRRAEHRYSDAGTARGDSPQTLGLDTRNTWELSGYDSSWETSGHGSWVGRGR